MGRGKGLSEYGWVSSHRMWGRRVCGWVPVWEPIIGFDDFSNLSCPIAQWHELARPCQPMFQKIEPEAGFQKRISRPPLPPHRFSSKQDDPPPLVRFPC